MLTTTQCDRLTQLHGQYGKGPWGKFLRDFGMWEKTVAVRVKLLGLDKGGPQVIWDLGCGVPFFVLAAKQYGHDASGLDYGGRILAIASDILDVPYVQQTLVLDEPLTPKIASADLISMYGVNLWDKSERWCWAEYERFAAAILERLVPGGRWVVQPNRGPLTAFVLDACHWNEFLGSKATATVQGDTLIITKGF